MHFSGGVNVTEPKRGEPRLPCRFIPIAAGTLRPLARLEFDLFVQNDRREPPVLFRQRELPLEQEDIDRLVANPELSLYVTELGHLKYQQYLTAHLAEFLAEEHTPLDVRCRFLHDAARVVLEDAFQIIDLRRTLDASRDLGRLICQLVLGRSLQPLEFYRLLRHDHALITHVVNVAAYSVLLAERLGICSADDVEELAMAALLHDLGLRNLPRHLLDSDANLTPEQRREVHRHPQAGFEELHGYEDVTWAQRMVVYQHHERCDGSGYPVRICREEIHWMARLCSVADTFDLLLRPAKNGRGLLMADVVKFLQDAAGRQLDSEMVACWLATGK